VLYILAALLIVLIVLAVLLLLRQGQITQAQLDPGETDRIVAVLSSNLTRVQGEIQKTGIEQLVAQNKTVLDGETARGEEQLRLVRARSTKVPRRSARSLANCVSWCARSMESAGTASSSWRWSLARQSSRPSCCAQRQVD
jgi:hypothetical protein